VPSFPAFEIKLRLLKYVPRRTGEEERKVTSRCRNQVEKKNALVTVVTVVTATLKR
jgi:hypothetical protein